MNLKELHQSLAQDISSGNIGRVNHAILVLNELYNDAKGNEAAEALHSVFEDLKPEEIVGNTENIDLMNAAVDSIIAVIGNRDPEYTYEDMPFLQEFDEQEQPQQEARQEQPQGPKYYNINRIDDDAEHVYEDINAFDPEDYVDEQPQAEESKVEEAPQVEEPQAEAPRVEEAPKAEEAPKVEAPKAEEKRPGFERSNLFGGKEGADNAIEVDFIWESINPTDEYAADEYIEIFNKIEEEYKKNIQEQQKTKGKGSKGKNENDKPVELPRDIDSALRSARATKNNSLSKKEDVFKSANFLMKETRAYIRRIPAPGDALDILNLINSKSNEFEKLASPDWLKECARTRKVFMAKQREAAKLHLSEVNDVKSYYNNMKAVLEEKFSELENELMTKAGYTKKDTGNRKYDYDHLHEVWTNNGKAISPEEYTKVIGNHNEHAVLMSLLEGADRNLKDLSTMEVGGKKSKVTVISESCKAELDQYMTAVISHSEDLVSTGAKEKLELGEWLERHNGMAIPSSYKYSGARAMASKENITAMNHLYQSLLNTDGKNIFSSGKYDNFRDTLKKIYEACPDPSKYDPTDYHQNNVMSGLMEDLMGHSLKYLDKVGTEKKSSDHGNIRTNAALYALYHLDKEVAQKQIGMQINLTFVDEKGNRERVQGESRAFYESKVGQKTNLDQLIEKEREMIERTKDGKKKPKVKPEKDITKKKNDMQMEQKGRKK